LPRLLCALTGGATSPHLDAHRATYAAPPPPGREPLHELIDVIEHSGLQGRGGGGFPLATKLRAVAAGKGPRVVVVNGSEGEPASNKDKTLLTFAPHLVIDGAQWAAAAVGATDIYICVDRRASGALTNIRKALEQRRGEGGATLHLVTVPARYVAGEESALVHLLNGGDARPTRTPPRPFQSGVRRAPTLVSNVETLCHAAQVECFGPQWFRQFGLADEPGTALITLSGSVEVPAVYEVPIGVRLSSMLAQAGGTQRGLAGVLVGGYYGTWLDAAQAGSACLSNRSLRPLGASLGCGAVVVLPAGACGLRETARVLTWMAGETAGQCGPCVHGLAAIAGAVSELAAGRPDVDTLARLQRWAGQVEGRGACRFPDGAVRLLRSAMSAFASDVAQHLQFGPCEGAQRPAVLHVPESSGVPWR
jgi:NADH:ubiquinone oxidoreductase subunit F (NADH-binding)